MIVGLFRIFDVSASVLLGSVLYPSVETSLPKYVTSRLKKLHFDVLILIPCFLSRCSTSLMWLRCSSNVFEKIRRSLKYGIVKLSPEYPRHCSMNLWNVAGAFINASGILTHS